MPAVAAPELPALIPAHAGVIPQAAYRAYTDTTYPRARGGDPMSKVEFMGHVVLSPRTRG